MNQPKQQCMKQVPEIKQYTNITTCLLKCNKKEEIIEHGLNYALKKYIAQGLISMILRINLRIILLVSIWKRRSVLRVRQKFSY